MINSQSENLSEIQQIDNPHLFLGEGLFLCRLINHLYYSFYSIFRKTRYNFENSVL